MSLSPHVARVRISFALRLGFGVLVVSALTALTACTRVAAYDRGKLAHPTMSPSDLAGPSEEHARAVQEGAIGGGFGAGGGCGCN